MKPLSKEEGICLKCNLKLSQCRCPERQPDGSWKKDKKLNSVFDKPADNLSKEEVLKEFEYKTIDIIIKLLLFKYKENKGHESMVTWGREQINKIFLEILDRYEPKLSEEKLIKLLEKTTWENIPFFGNKATTSINRNKLLAKAICKEFGEPKPLDEIFENKFFSKLSRYISLGALEEIKAIFYDAKAICENEKELREG
jgi:hypothetical protein